MIPEKLHKGNRIGIVSPSDSVTDNLMEQFDNGVRFFRNLGFEVVIAKNALSNTLGYSASPQEKAEDINNMFADHSVKAIICSQGGNTSNSCLPFLDWEIIKKNPKVFLGMSDISVLLNAIYVKTGLVTFHGNDIIWGFGKNPTRYDELEFIERFMNSGTGKINKNSEWNTIREGRAKGRLLGGNLRCFLKLAGTPYFPDFTDSILFVESFRIIPEACDYAFNQLKQIGVFDEIKGVIVGYVYSLQNRRTNLVQMEDVLLRVTEEYDFPILKVNDFGHTCPNTALPIGIKLKIDAYTKELAILDRCVS